jgi:hypothetical protein
MSRRLQVVGVRAEFWARDTGADRETVLFGPDYFTPTSLTPATMARMMSTSGADDGAVDFWPEVGGQTEIRDADTGETVWVYRGGRRFKPAALAEAEARLAAPATPAPPAAPAAEPEPATEPRWVTEFGAAYDVPAAVLDAGLPDVSWHNDACPAFGSSERDDDHVLWVEHPDPAERELDGGRFTVTNANGDSVLYEGDDVADALAAYRFWTETPADRP